ncbi:MAG: hypothetical protein ACFBZ8_09185 [Opitutales bacterium]
MSLNLIATTEVTGILAGIIVVGALILVLVAYLKKGSEDAAKMWGLLGTAVGAVVSYYFTDQANQAVEQQLTQQVSNSQQQLEQTEDKLITAASQVYELKSANTGLSLTVASLDQDLSQLQQQTSDAVAKARLEEIRNERLKPTLQVDPEAVKKLQQSLNSTPVIANPKIILPRRDAAE